MNTSSLTWTVDYGAGPQPCSVPHAWRQDVDVRWEGPAVYRTKLAVETEDQWLVFHGVSYRAIVSLNGEVAIDHKGIWDAFSVRLPVGLVDVRVEVVKNGGATYPVKDVLSGFLPYVFHTFGGIFREVEVVHSDAQPFGDGSGNLIKSPRIGVAGTKLFIDGQPWFMRGVLTWGWYPAVGAPHPPMELVRDEVRRVRDLGFNTVKFCLWLPPHHYLQVLEEEDMWAWVELPLWMPTGDEEKLEAMFAEVERIVRQYRHHDRIVCWTCGCELSESTPHGYRKRLFEMVRELTGCPLVKDNSGGSEMYGGDLREYGTFYDFHPYCDTMFYPPVLDSLMPGPRKTMPVMLGEFNDYDVYRPLAGLRERRPFISDPEHPWINREAASIRSCENYWASSDPRLNDQGVRWLHDLPSVLADPQKELPPDIEEHLSEESRSRCGWIREFVTNEVAARDAIAGYIVTGIADTPISKSGVLGDPLHSPGSRDLSGVFDDLTFFVVPFRMPPWVDGGNRPGWWDSSRRFTGTQTIQIGARSVRGFSGEIHLIWENDLYEAQSVHVSLPPDTPAVVADLTIELREGPATLWIKAEGRDKLFGFQGYETLEWKQLPQWSVEDPLGLVGGNRTGEGEGVVTCTGSLPSQGVALLSVDGTVALPFWRENVSWNQSGERFLGCWDDLLPVSTDRAIDPTWLDFRLPGAEWLLTRVDTRTYARHPYLARKGHTVVTTLRPWGGLGAQPYGLAHNPAGCELLRILMSLSASG